MPEDNLVDLSSLAASSEATKSQDQIVDLTALASGQTNNSVVSGSAFRIDDFTAKATKRREYRTGLEALYKSTSHAFNGDGVLTPNDQIEIDNQVNAVVPLNPVEEEAEARLRGDPSWLRYKPGKVSSADAYEQFASSHKWTGIGFLVNAYSQAPKGVQDVVAQGAMQSVDGLANALGGTLKGAISLTQASSNMMGAGAALSLLPGEQNYPNAFAVYLKENIDDLVERVDKQLPDISVNKSDPNRAAVIQRAPGGKTFFTYDDSNPELAPDPGFSPLGASKFFGQLTGQFAFYAMSGGLLSKALGFSSTGVQTVGQVEKMHKATAAFMTLGSIGNTQKEIKQELIAKGVKPDDAESKSLMTAIALAPLQFQLNKLGPLSKLVSGKPLAEEFPGMFGNWLGKTIASSMFGAVQSAGDRAAVEMVGRVIGTKGLDSDGLRASMESVIEAGGTGALAGTFFAGIDLAGDLLHPEQKAIFINEQMLNYRDPNAWGKRELYQQAFNEFVQKNADKAMSTTELVDGLMKMKAVKENIGREAAYGLVFANMMERAGNLPGLTLFQPSENVRGMYSKLENVLNSTEFRNQFKKKTDAASLLGYLQNKGIKEEELKWSGLNWLLRDQPQKQVESDPLGKQVEYNADELIEFHRKNMTRLEMVRKGGKADPAVQKQLIELGSQIHQLEGEISRSLNEYVKKKPGTPEWTQSSAKLDQLKDQHYQLQEKLNDLRNSSNTSNTSYNSVSLPGPRSDYQEWLLLVPEQKNPETGKKVSYQGGHWDEENVLVHIRADVRETEQGRTLFVNEIQSDWHQEGRERGYLDSEVSQRLKVLSKEIEDTELAYDKHISDWDAAKDQETKRAINVRDHELLAKRTSLVTERETLLDKIAAGPFSKTWTELALKKILIEATNQGHDRITFATGEMNDLFQGVIDAEQSAGRKKFYDEILWNKLREVLKQAGVKEPRVESSKFSIDGKSPKLNFDFTEFEDTQFRNQNLQEDVRKALSDAYVSIEENPETHARETAVKDLHTELHRLKEFYPSQEYQRFLDKFDSRVEDVSRSLPAPTLVLSPADAQKIKTNGFSLFAPDRRAAVTLLDNGKAIIHALKDPDIGSLVHELGHIVRNAFISGDDLASLERLFGVKNGQWEVKHEEAFAQTFVRWLRQDRGAVQVVPPKYYSIFSRMAEYLKDTYLQAKQITGAQKLNAEFEGIMRRMFLEDTQPVKAAEEAVTHAEAKVENAKKAVEGFKASIQKPQAQWTPQELADYTKLTSVYDAEKAGLKADQTLLQRAVDQQVSMGPEHPAVKRAQRLEWVEKLALGPKVVKNYWQDRIGLITQAKGFLKSLGDILGHSPVVDSFKALTDDIHTQMSIWSGKFQNTLIDTFEKRLSRDDVSNAAKIDPSIGLPDFVRMYDKKGVLAGDELQADPKLAPLFKLMDSARNFMSDMMETLRTVRRLPSGEIREFSEDPTPTVPRMLTEDGFWLFSHDGHPAFQEFKRLVIDKNGITEQEFNLWFQSEQGDARTASSMGFTRRSGQVEGSRKIKYLPFQVKYKTASGFDGTWNVFHSDPVELVQRWLGNGFKRLAIVQGLGQSLIPDKFQSVSDMRNMLKIFGVRSGLTKSDFEAKIKKAQLWDQAVHGKMNMKELVQAMKGKVRATYEPDELLAMVHGLSWRDLVNRQFDPDPKKNAKLRDKAIEELKKLAREATRVGVKKDITQTDQWRGLPEMIDGLKIRFAENLIDNGREIYRKAMENEGKDVNNFDRVWGVFQGRPQFNMEGNVLLREMNNVFRVTGSLMTSLSGIPNLVQPLLIAGEFGPLKVAKAYAGVFSNYTKLLQEGRDTGAVRSEILRFASEKSHWTSRLAENFSKATARTFMLARIDEVNQVVAMNVGQQTADQWKAGKFSGKDASLAKFLRLTDEDVSKIKTGKMDDFLYKKIVQQTVRVTQGRGENPLYRSGLEQHALYQSLFQFQTYTSLMTRWSYETTRRAIADFKYIKTDPGRTAASLTKFLVGLGVALGVSELQRMLREAVTRKPKREFAGLTERALADIVDIQFMGHASRFFQPTSPWVQADPVLSMMPGVAALNDFLSHVVFAYGRARNQELPERLYNFGKQITPAYIAGGRQFEYELYPERERFDLARATYSNWERKQSWFVQDTSEHAKDEDLFDVFEELARGRYQEAQARYSNYLQGALGKYQDDGRDPRKLLANTRSSLLNRRPIPQSNPIRKAAFLNSLSEEKRMSLLQLDAKYAAVVKAMTGGN